MKDSAWYNQPGIGITDKGTRYGEQSFRWARNADAKALLFYNDNGGEGLNRKSDAIYAMLKDFKQRDVPVDGFGLPMHISRLDYDTDAVSKNVARLTKIGLQVHITLVRHFAAGECAGRESRLHGHSNLGIPRPILLDRVSLARHTGGRRFALIAAIH